jgi:Ca2+-binding RTX toxin-like protein
MKATRDFGAAVTEFSAQSGYDAAKGGTGLLADAFEDTSKSLYGQVKKASLLLFIGEAVINAIDELIASDLVLGGDGSDVLYGLAGHDILIGGRGDDHLFGGRGVDVLYGGAGNDMLHAGSGGFDDDLIGGQGNDQYWVARSTDRVTDFASDEGIDVVTTEVSYDLNNLLAGGVEHLIGIGRRHIDLTANDLDNLVLGNLAHNRITGHAGDDTLSGLTGKDTVSGGTGHDVLLGGDHRDTLGGGAGNDTLDGGAGADVLTGGSDADVFLFASSAEADGDRITDFVQGVDRIDLGRIWSEVYPDGQGDGPAGLEFTGTTRSTEEGTVHYRQKTGLISGEQTTEIRINIDGGLLSEAKIILDGHYVLLADDFYLFWGL